MKGLPYEPEKYSTVASTCMPALLILMIEQSLNMLDSCGDKCPAIMATHFINRAIDAYIQKNFDGERPKDRIYIVVIGYGYKASIITSGWLSEIDEHPIRIEIIKKKVLDRSGGILEIECKRPVWMDVYADGQFSNLKGAFIKAKRIIEEWFANFNNNENYIPSPIIFNLSKSAPNYGMKEIRVCMKETECIVRDIQKLTVKDGGCTMVLNCLMEPASQVYKLYSDKENLQSETEKFFFDISSEIPIERRWRFDCNGLQYKSESRGYANDINLALDLLMACGPIDVSS